MASNLVSPTRQLYRRVSSSTAARLLVTSPTKLVTGPGTLAQQRLTRPSETGSQPSNATFSSAHPTASSQFTSRVKPQSSMMPCEPPPLPGGRGSPARSSSPSQDGVGAVTDSHVHDALSGSIAPAAALKRLMELVAGVPLAPTSKRHDTQGAWAVHARIFANIASLKCQIAQQMEDTRPWRCYDLPTANPLKSGPPLALLQEALQDVSRAIEIASSKSDSHTVHYHTLKAEVLCRLGNVTAAEEVDRKSVV